MKYTTPKRQITTLLTSVGRFLHVDMVYVVKNSTWVFIAKWYGTLGTFLLSLAFANLVSPQVYGTYAYLISLSLTLGSLSLTGLSRSVIIAAAEHKDGTFHDSIRLSRRWGYVVAGIGTIGAAYYAIQGNSTLAIGLLLVSIFLPFDSSGSLFNSFLRGKEQFRAFAWSEVILSTVKTVLLTIAMLLYPHAAFLVGAYVIPKLCFLLLFTRYTKKTFVLNEDTDPTSLSHGKHLSVQNFFLRGTKELDTILLFQMVGSSEVALYIFASALPNTINTITRTITSTALPKIVPKSVHRIKKQLVKLLPPFVVILILLGAAYYMIAPYLFSLFFPTYIDAVPFSRIAVIASIIPTSIVTNILTGKKRIREQYYLSVSIGILRGVLCLLLIPYYSIWGAVFSNLIATIIYFIAGLFFVFRMKEHTV